MIHIDNGDGGAGYSGGRIVDWEATLPDLNSPPTSPATVSSVSSVNSAVNTDVNAPVNKAADRKAYMREYMRQKRERQRALGTQDTELFPDTTDKAAK